MLLAAHHVPTTTEVAGIVGESEVHTLDDLKAQRPKTVAFELAKLVLDRYFQYPDSAAGDGMVQGPRPWLFPRLVEVSRSWMAECVTCQDHAFPQLLLLHENRNDAAERIYHSIVLTIGPQYGTVGPSFIKDAAREANQAGDLDLLCVLAFAFDPSVLGAGDEYVTSEEGFANVAAERRLGRIPVLLVRMNAELVMGEELKKTGAGNLFTVFGEPDITIEEGGGEMRVILHGVDVYDPNTGELRSNDTSQIALWMIDTEYNEESFFVRHCYFTGGQDPFARLKRALKADIDEDAWASLYRTESRPFPRPESGKIAVKVINDYGDEVMKVFSV